VYVMTPLPASPRLSHTGLAMAYALRRTRKHVLNLLRRCRALELLADCPQEGCSEVLMLAHGFTIPQLVNLVNAGFATAKAARIKGGGQTIEIAVLRITTRGARRWRLHEVRSLPGHRVGVRKAR
jgi:hypothetical protein